MSHFSNYAENVIINLFFRGTAYTPPAKIYVALYTSDPGEDDSGTEVSGGSYARQEFIVDAPTDGVTHNTGEILFPVATADWGTVSHFALRDAAMEGNMIMHGALQKPKLIEVDDRFAFPLGNLEVKVQ